MRHLIHVGYPKCGSTFLQDWFFAHPEVFYHPGALGGYTDPFDICRAAATENHETARARFRVTSAEALAAPHESTGSVRMTNDISQSFPPSMKLSQGRTCQELNDLFPGSSILIVTRGFSASLRSNYSQIVKTGGIYHPQALFAALDDHLKSELLDYFDYNYLIGLYRENFGASNVIVLPFELLRDDESAFLDLLQDEMGLTRTALQIPRRNVSLSPAELYWYPLISRGVAGVAVRLGARNFRRIYTMHVHKTRKNKWRRVISQLHRFYPDKVVTASDFHSDFLDSFRGKAESLRGNPLYAPYAQEYLLD